MSETSPSFDAVIYERIGPVARIVLNRPPVNAINFQLTRDLNAALDFARRDETVRSVIITGSGEQAFSAGVDLKVLEPADGREMRRFLEIFYFEMVEIQYKMGKPTIAALNGPALAAGVTIAVSCDLLIASERAQMGYPEINVGLSPAMHLVLLPRLVGKYKAFELCFTGDPIDAAEALRLGLVNKVVRHDRVQDEALALAQKLASKSPLATKYMRDVFYRNLDVEFRKGIGNAADLVCLLKDSADSHEGMRAFKEKRAPQWTGR
ncbi:MAG: enoyl-CoA hydratase/isomerase family protein [Chloroflexi bacterium]|nr:enoyl-CoA hydratase/isomerase family protein [Chloroflexota bacterium]